MTQTKMSEDIKSMIILVLSETIIFVSGYSYLININAPPGIKAGFVMVVLLPAGLYALAKGIGLTVSINE